MEDMLFKGLKKAVEDLKEMEDGDVAFVTYDKKSHKVVVDGYCEDCFLYTSFSDIIADVGEFLDFKVFKPMTEKELKDLIEFGIDMYNVGLV